MEVRYLAVNRLEVRNVVFAHIHRVDRVPRLALHLKVQRVLGIAVAYRQIEGCSVQTSVQQHRVVAFHPRRGDGQCVSQRVNTQTARLFKSAHGEHRVLHRTVNRRAGAQCQ